MKLHVELSEKDVQVKLDELIGDTVKRITDAYIAITVVDVVDKKFARLKADKCMEEACERRLEQEYGKVGAFGGGKLGKIIRDTALDMLTEQFDKTGIKR